MNNAEDVINDDLNYILDNLKDEFNIASGKSILIVGGAGSLGYYLVKSIVLWNEVNPNCSIEISVVDNFFRGYPKWLKNLKYNNKIKLIKHDITNPLKTEIGFFDYIIHGATIASPVIYRKYPIETMNSNVDGLRNLLNFTIKQVKRTKKNISGFLFFSTSEIYGDPPSNLIPTPENYNGNVSPIGPRSCYDESKRYGETLCYNFAKMFDLPITIVRPFNNYGPGLNTGDGRVTADFAKNIFNNEDIVILSDGKPTRTFCYISDAIIGYYKTLIKGKAGEPYNIGTKHPEISMFKLAKIYQEYAQNYFDYNKKIVFKKSKDKDYLSDNPSRRCPIIDKAEKELGFHPSIDLDRGILKSLFWYNENNELGSFYWEYLF